MKNKRPFKLSKGGLYIALCCCALVIAAIGYAGNKQNIDNENDSILNIADSDINEKQSEILYDYDTDFEDDTDIVTVTDDVSDMTDDYNTEDLSEDSDASVSEDDTTETETAVSKTVEVEEFKLKMPVEGSVLSAFSGDELIYNEILSDWRTHNGIDISCDADSAIYCAASGIVTDIYDNELGKNVQVDHQNGYVTVYANLSDQIEVAVGDTVSEGTLIGKAGSESVGDFTSDPHLHFEVLCNGKYLDPTELLINEQ